MTKKLRFVFARHANTDKNPVDVNRKLTEKGREQALCLNDQMKQFKFDLVLCSSSRRARETLDCIGLDAHTRVVFLNALYEMNNTEDMQAFMEMYKEMSPTNLKTYLRHRNAYVLEIIGKEGQKAIKEELKKSKTVLVLSHDVFLNCIIREMFPTLKPFAEDTIFGETTAVEVVVQRKITMRIIN